MKQSIYLKISNHLAYSVLLIIPLIFLPRIINLGFELPKQLAFRIFVLLMLFFFTLDLFKARDFYVLSIFKKSTAKKILIGSLLIIVFATIFSIAPRLSFWGSYFRIQGLYSFLHYFLFFLLLTVSFKEQIHWDTAKKFIFTAIFVSAVYGIMQFFGLDLKGYDLQENSLGRIFSSFGHPNYMAYFIILIIFPFITFIVNEKRKWLTCAMLLVILFALAMTESRGAFVGLLAGTFIYLILIGVYFRKNWLIIVSLILPLLFVGFTVFVNLPSIKTSAETIPVINRLVIFGENSRSIKSRLTVWPASLKMIAARPFFGYGPETFGMAFQKYASPEMLQLENLNSISDKPHNTLLEIASNYGIVGFAFYLYALVSIFWLSILRLKNLDKARKLEIIGVLASFFGLFVANMFGFSTTVHFVVTVFWLAYLAFLLSDEFIKKPLPVLDKKWARVLTISLVSIFVFASIIFEDIFFLIADHNAAQGLDPNKFSEAVLLYPNQRDYSYILSAILYEKKDYKNALYYAEKAGEFTSYKDSYYYFLKGMILGKTCKDNCAEALATYKTGYELAPTYPPILLNWGIFYADHDQCNLAMEKFEKYFELVPDSWEKPGTEKYRLFYKHNPDFDQVFKYMDKCKDG